MIHVFIGTKAQYIKTAPLLRRMDREGVPYRLIDSGQHASLAVGLREELGVREPDLRFGDKRDVTTIPQAIGWSARIGWKLTTARQQLLDDIFDGQPGICVVHGDTPSTLLSALLARRAGLKVAHLEAGLRSGAWWDPFPEELIRIMVMRTAHLLFSPDATATANLQRMNVKGRTVQVVANTVVEQLAESLPDGVPADKAGPAIFTMHRVENLKHNQRVVDFVDLVCAQAGNAEAAPNGVEFVVHGPTEVTLDAKNLRQKLGEAGVTVTPLLPHDEFTRRLANAPYVVTDGGSIQEECALIGVPCALWRERTERPDGVGRNVVITKHDKSEVVRVIESQDQLRHDPVPMDQLPSEQILTELIALDATTA